MKKYCFFVDEARKVFSVKHERDLEFSDLSILASRAAEFDICLAVSDQIPSELSRAFIGNSPLKFIFNLGNADDIRIMSQSANLSREQTEYIPVLKSGQAIVKKSGCPIPFVIEIPLMNIRKDVTDEEVREHSKAFIEYLQKDVKPANPSVLEQYLNKEKIKKEREMDEKEKDFMKHIARKPLMTMTQRYEEFGISRAMGDRLVDSLERKGLIKRVEIMTGERGGTPKYLDFTDRGKKYVHEQLGVKTSHLNRGIEHYYFQNNIKNWLCEMEGVNATVETFLKNTRIDVLAEVGGKMIAVECAMSPEYELENIKKDLQAGCEFVIVVLRNWIGVTSIKKELQKLNIESRVVFILAKEFRRKREWIIKELSKSSA